uniref:Choline transporter-like protein n=1 Tax=Rhabditophanes sp. KR3021 TaxID=114890 RepID=A0AC35TZ33_9BILA
MVDSSHLYTSLGDQPKQVHFDANKTATTPILQDKQGSNVLRPNIVLATPRQRTDTCFLYFFGLFMVVWLGLAFYMYTTGNVNKKSLTPHDSEGRMCGEIGDDYDFSNKQNLIFFDMVKCISVNSLVNKCETPQVCVETCPVKNFIYSQIEGLPWEKVDKSEIVCIDNKTKNSIKSYGDFLKAIRTNLCSAYLLKSVSLFGRCVPVSFKTKKHETDKVEDVKELVVNHGDKLKLLAGIHKLPSMVETIKENKSFTLQLIEDLWNSYNIILFGFGLSVLIAGIYLNLLKYLGGLIIYISIVTTLLVLLGTAIICFYQCTALTTSTLEQPIPLDINFSNFMDDPDAWKYGSIFFSVIFIIFLFLCLFMKKRIKLAFLMINETSKAVRKIPGVFILPVIPLLMNGLFLMIWVALSFRIPHHGTEMCQIKTYSFGGDFISAETCDCSLAVDIDSECKRTDFKESSAVNWYFQSFNLFCFFWASCFVSAYHDMVLAGAFSVYYWTFNKKENLPKTIVKDSLRRTTKYHLGTVAMGSIMIAFVKFLRATIEVLQKSLKGSKNKFSRFIYTMLRFFFWILEKFLNFLNKNTYVITAIHGTPFYTSAKTAVKLIFKNLVNYQVVDWVTTILLFFGKLSISLISGGMTLYYVTQWEEGSLNDQLNYWLTPVLVVIFGSYYIVDLFFDVYAYGVSALFMSYMVDCEMNDGSDEKPYYMSKKLLKRMKKGHGSEGDDSEKEMVEMSE